MKNNIKHSPAMVILDVEKAYGTIWRSLMCKMNNQDAIDHIIKIIDSYLNERIVKVKTQDMTSNKIETEEGSP